MNTILPFGPWRLARLSDLVLGTDPERRFALRLMVVIIAVYIACAGLAILAMRLSMMAPGFGRVLLVYMAATQVAFYALVRGGWTAKLSNIGLVLPQSVCGMIAVLLAYVACEAPLRPVVMTLMPLVLVHCMFFAEPRQAAVLCGVIVASIPGLVALMTTLQPERFHAPTEWLAAGVVAVMLPALTIVSGEVGALRRKLMQQKEALIIASRRLEELATHDDLTGLLNRREIRRVLAEHLALSQRNGTAFSVAMLDLDHFKRINDTWGHAVGDEVLRGFALRVREVLREVDVIARWGGEEFLVLMPEAPPGNPGLGLDRLRAQLAALQLSGKAPGLRAAFSAGVATHAGAETIDELVERADKALYQAKASGRNCTVVLAATPRDGTRQVNA